MNILYADLQGGGYLSGHVSAKSFWGTAGFEFGSKERWLLTAWLLAEGDLSPFRCCWHFMHEENFWEENFGAFSGRLSARILNAAVKADLDQTGRSAVNILKTLASPRWKCCRKRADQSTTQWQKELHASWRRPGV